MKKLLIFSGLILLLTNCTKTEKVISQEEFDRQQKEKINKRIKKIEFEGHTYLLYSASSSENGICHDENCKCKQK